MSLTQFSENMSDRSQRWRSEGIVEVAQGKQTQTRKSYVLTMSHE